MTWADILTHWDAVECDLQDRGVDLEDRALLAARSWRWLRVRIIGLLSADTRTARALREEASDGTQAG